jgi:hypothetical protein
VALWSGSVKRTASSGGSVLAVRRPEDTPEGLKIRLVAKHEPTYRIDPIEPTEIGARFMALLTRLEPSLDPADVTSLRSLIERGDHAAAFARLDAITDAATVSFETSALVELVLLGQAIRAT